MKLLSNADEILEERAQRLREVCAKTSVQRCFPLLNEIALPANLHTLVRDATLVYLLSCLKTANPQRSYPLCNRILTRYREDILRLPNRTPNGKLCAKEEVALEFNLVQRSCELLFNHLGFASHADLVQLPINVRIQDGAPDPTVENRPYATSKIHSDIWTGEATDSTTLILPVMGDIERTGLEFFEPYVNSVENFCKTYGDYLDTAPWLKTAKKYDCNMKPNCLYIFDSYCLHQTMKRNGGVRISIDFRFLYKKKVSSDLQRDASRLPYYVPYADWCTLDRDTFLQPTQTFGDALRKFGGPSVPRGGVADKEFSVLHRSKIWEAA